jgi:hypothetical protein
VKPVTCSLIEEEEIAKQVRWPKLLRSVVRCCVALCGVRG